MNTGRLGVAIGDVTGVGPEVTLKALSLEARESDTKFLIIGDGQRLRALNERLRLEISFQEDLSDTAAQFQVYDPLSQTLPATLSPGAAPAAEAALAYLREGARRCLQGE